ncbi:transcription factor subunit Med10 of mediator complex-domain-containing protein [Syncephalis fuscata]|nr:transcription factor subunit Med10 of mediator complex-domain-containing protein [Syncephalis fuscata]
MASSNGVSVPGTTDNAADSLATTNHALESFSTPQSTGHVDNATEQLRVQLEAQLGETVNSLFTLGLSVYDFQTGTDALLRHRVNELVTRYRDLTELGSNMEIMIPEEVIRYVEDGRNPDLFSREFAERTVAENQFANGRMKAFETFGQQLMEELGQVLPAHVIQSYERQTAIIQQLQRQTVAIRLVRIIAITITVVKHRILIHRRINICISLFWFIPFLYISK